jgi:hypothetical protein
VDRLTSKRSSIDPVVTMGFSQISSTSARAFGVPNGGRGLAVALASSMIPRARPRAPVASVWTTAWVSSTQGIASPVSCGAS